MSTHDNTILLGKQVAAPTQYAPEILFPIPRHAAGQPVFMHGCDRWTAWELSWLNDVGVPQVAVAELVFSVDAPSLIESKSLKLYLHSLSSMRHPSSDAVASVIQRDVSHAAQSDVTVTLFALHTLPTHLQPSFPVGALLLDTLVIDCDSADEPSAALLRLTSEQGDNVVTELLATHLFQSHCPVTGQPDWASVFVRYTGHAIDHTTLLRYLCAFRQHQAFHESCVEKIFTDLMATCTPTQLTVEAHFLRRGGLDINPVRSTDAAYQALAERQHRQ